MKTTEELLADLTKRHAQLVKMSGVHKGHFDTLNAEDAEAFLAKSVAERDVIVGEVVKRELAGNELKYVSKSTGAKFYAKDDPRMIEMAKSMDDQAETIEKAEISVVAKAHLGNIVGDAETHEYIVKSIRRGGGDAAMIAKALTTLLGANGIAGEKGISKGAPGGEPSTAEPIEKFNAGLAVFAKATNRTNVQATADYMATVEGSALYADATAHIR